MTNIIKLYEVVNKKDDLIGFSPFVIATKLFLKHKGLEFETIPLTFVEVGPTISKLTNGKWSKVPLLQFPNGDFIYDSLKIGQYLESAYPNPALNNDIPNLDQLIQEYDLISDLSFSWAITDLYNTLDRTNQAYFIPSRETMLGQSIKDFTSNLDNNLIEYHNRTKNIGDLLDAAPYLNGKEPGFYDYVLIGRIQFLRLVSPKTFEKFIIEHPSKSILTWVNRMLNLYDGYLKNANSVSNI